MTKSPGLYPRSRTFRGVRCSSNGWLETALFTAMAVNSPCPVAEGVAGKPGLFLPGRKLYFRYSSQGVHCRAVLGLFYGGILEAGLGGGETE